MPTKLPKGPLGQKATHPKANGLEEKATKKELLTKFSIVHIEVLISYRAVFFFANSKVFIQNCFNMIWFMMDILNGWKCHREYWIPTSQVDTFSEYACSNPPWEICVPKKCRKSKIWNDLRSLSRGISICKKCKPAEDDSACHHNFNLNKMHKNIKQSET